jgi:hypothetical protein
MDEKSKWIPQLSLQVNKLAEQLQAGKIGDTLTFAQLQTTIGMTFTINQLLRARRRCLRGAGKWWELIPGAQTLKCCNASEMVQVGENDRRKLHRASKRAVHKLSIVDVKQLNTSEHTQFNSLVAQHGTLAAFSSTNASKALAAKNADKAIELPKLLEALK